MLIANPLPGHNPHIGQRRADRLIRTGRARVVSGKLILLHPEADAAARERAANLDCVVHSGIANRKQRKGIGICGDPDAMIRAGSAGEGAWHWQHSVYRQKQGSSKHSECQS